MFLKQIYTKFVQKKKRITPKKLKKNFKISHPYVNKVQIRSEYVNALSWILKCNKHIYVFQIG